MPKKGSGSKSVANSSKSKQNGKSQADSEIKIVPGKQSWTDRIVGHGVAPASAYIGHDLNFRTHSAEQKAALLGSLDELGWIGEVTVTKYSADEYKAGTGQLLLVDGHGRLELALLKGDATPVPYAIVDLSESEANLALAVYDKISAMAGVDEIRLAQLLDDVSSGESALQQLLADLAADNGIVPLMPLTSRNPCRIRSPDWVAANQI